MGCATTGASGNRRRRLTRVTQDANRLSSQTSHMIREHGAGPVAIIDDGQVAGVVTMRDITNIERLLDRLDTDP